MLSRIRFIGVLVLRLAVAVGIVLAAATALSAQPTYRLHDNGDLWVSRVEWCRGISCVEWHLLDNNPNTREITAGAGPSGGFDPLKAPPDAAPLYQRHADGKIWIYTGKPCNGGSCPGWQLLDNNPLTVSIVAAGKHLYQRHSDGAIWSYTGTPCRPDGSCPGWQRLDDNPNTAEITAGGLPDQTELYQRHKDGKIWRYKGTPCDDTSCPAWELLDNNPNTRELTATVRRSSAGVLVQALYQRHDDGKVWRYTGKPCEGASSCQGWQLIDDNPRTISIVTATWHLYQLRNDGTIWVHTDKPCKDGLCPGWLLLDNNPRSSQIAAGAVSLYQRHDNGTIWRYTGPPCEDATCRGWQLLYDPTTWTIVSTQQ